MKEKLIPLGGKKQEIEMHLHDIASTMPITTDTIPLLRSRYYDIS
jgi:hypothetical protein